LQKPNSRWEGPRNSNTNIRGDLKIGANVTITYTMTATDMEVKPNLRLMDMCRGWLCLAKGHDRRASSSATSLSNFSR